MDVPAAVTNVVRHQAWLPYWAVFQTDLWQTVRGWTYRFWVLASVLTTIGFVLYRLGVYREAGIVVKASELVGGLLHWAVVGSLALIVIITVASIALERGALADGVLSRGVSRHQFFLAKWHARLVAILGTALVLASGALMAAWFLLHEDMNPTGCAVALATVASLLLAVVTVGVTVSALASNTLVAVAGLWVALSGLAVLMAYLPAGVLTPDRLLARLPAVLRGEWDATAHLQTIAAALVVTGASAAVGMVGFSRRDF